MANMIKELKKGNHTLTLKVKSLEDTVAFQDLEIIRIRTEKDSLKRKISNIETKKETSELSIVNYLCGMTANVIESNLKVVKGKGNIK